MEGGRRPDERGIIAPISGFHLPSVPIASGASLPRQKLGVLDELAAEQVKRLEIENAELELQADRLAEEIKQLDSKAAVT